MRPPRIAVPLYMRHAQASLNYLCYAVILYVYLADLSFLRGLLRLILQSQFLYKRDQSISKFAIVWSGLVFVFCAAVHLFDEIPKPGPLAHGYNHGGLFVDFVGQRPLSRGRLVLLDVLLLFLHLLLVEVVYMATLPGRSGGQSTDPQTLDDEERGELSDDYGKIILHLGVGLIHFMKVKDDDGDEDVTASSTAASATTALPRTIPPPSTT